MRIYVKNTSGAKKRKFCFMIPTLFLFSPLCARLAILGAKHGVKKTNSAHEMSEEDAEAIAKALPLLCREIRRYRRRSGRFTLVEVNSSDGTSVRITL